MQQQIEFAATYAALENMGDNTMKDNLRSLPQSRLLKIYSSTLNIFGLQGPIPPGMTAQSALAFKNFEANYNSITNLLTSKIESFEQENLYKPTYPRLLQLALVSGRQ